MSAPSAAVTSAPGIDRFRVWGTSGTLAVQPSSALVAARALLERELTAFDRTCNRFRPDSELARCNRAGGAVQSVSPLLAAAVAAALGAAEATGGAVDPTVGRSLVDLGYDRDFDELAGAAGVALSTMPGPAPGWRTVGLDVASATLTLPGGVQLDLGASAKALCADRAAAAIWDTLGAAALVDLGGDLAIAGPPPPGGWQVAVVSDAKCGALSDECVVTVWGGGLASSGTTVRRWSRGGRSLHHIVDPTTGWPCEPVWQMVTVAAGSALHANTASTAAVVWGDAAPFRIAQMGLPARFVGHTGAALEVGGWPPPSAVPEPIAVG